MTPHQKTRKIDPLQSGISSLGQLVASAGLSPDSFLTEFRSDLLQTADPSRALTNFLRYLESGFSSKLLRDFSDQRFLQRVILEVFSQSQYLADILIRDPELFGWLTLGGAMKRTRTREDLMKEARQVIGPFGRLEKKLDALKRFHRREMLRLGVREILKEADIDTVTAELSMLAEAIIQAVLELSDADLRARTGYEGPNTLAVIGLGKLGGGELNFSSDVDLMFVYDQDGEFHAPQERIHSLHEYFTRLSESLLRRMTESTSEGHFYRVDMRLRPDGNVGPLAMSRVSYRHYYESRGELWERQMLTKARVVAGNEEIGRSFHADIRPFVYPKTHLDDPREVIYGIKRKIEMKVQVIENVKLGSGGIRDIEFIVQALQLLYGGVRPELDVSGTLEALQRVWQSGLIGDRDVQELTQGYQFLRMVEHRLQLLMGRQTHSLPQSEEEILLLAKRLSYPSSASFRRDLDRHRSNIRRMFDQFFLARKVDRPPTDEPVPDGAMVIPELLAFEEYDDALRHLRIIREELSLSEGDENLTRLLSLLKSHGAPDWGLKNYMLLASAKLIKRSLQFAMSFPKPFELILLICSRSSAMTMTLAEEPLLFETLIGQPDEFFKEGESFDHLKKPDIRRFKLFNEFKFLLRLLLGEVSIQVLTRELSELSRAVLMQVYEDVVSEHSHPLQSSNLCFIGLGTLGSQEMTFRSDVDGIFVMGYPERTERDATPEIYAREFLAKMEQIGVYAIDLRLRPEGKSSPILSDPEYLQQYLRDRAGLWERQSLTKARFVFGSEGVWSILEEMIQGWVYDSTLPPNWIMEVRTMRDRLDSARSRGKESGSDLKAGRGGIIDIEFVIQMIQLRFGGREKELRVHNTYDVLRHLSRINVLPGVDVPRIEENLKFMRKLETLIRINSETSAFFVPSSGSSGAAIAAGMGLPSVDDLRNAVTRVQKENRKIFDSVAEILEREGKD